MSIIQNIQTQLDEEKYCAEVFVDLKKAFDTFDVVFFENVHQRDHGKYCIS